MKNIKKCINNIMKNFTIFITIIVILILLILINKKNQIKSFIKYEKINIEYEKINNELHKKNITTKIVKKINKYISENKDIYSFLITLNLSEKYIKWNNIKKAIILLKHSISTLKDENLKKIIKFKIIKLEIQQKRYNAAKIILSSIIKENGWDNIIKDIQGTLYFITNKKKCALKIWKSSIDDQLDEESKSIIKMKTKYLENNSN